MFNTLLNKFRKQTKHEEKTISDKWAEKELDYWYHEKDTDNFLRSYHRYCGNSALKAFESLCEDNHSGLTMSITRDILYRLTNHIPLTKIEDTDDVWKELGKTKYDNPHLKRYQCKRMSSLFKEVYSDGTIKYTENHRYYEKDMYGISTDVKSCPVVINRIMDELYPITMPYLPDDKPYYIYREMYRVSSKIDTKIDTKIAIRYILTPSNDLIKVNRYFKLGDYCSEISEEEYKNLYSLEEETYNEKF